MSRPSTRRQVLRRTLAVIFGAALLTYLIKRLGPNKLVESISTLGWGLALIIALGGVSHIVKAWAWRMTLAGWRGRVSFSRMLQLRMASEAVGQLGVLGHLFGEGLRVSGFDPSIPIDNRISSVILDRTLFIVTGAIVSGVGVLAGLLIVSLTHALRLYAALFAFTLISVLSIVTLALLKRWPVLSRSARAIGRLRPLSRRWESMLPLIHSVENKLFDFHRYTPGAFWASLALNLACHGMAVLEVYLVLWLLGVKIGFLGALVFEALTKLVNAVGTFNPGNIGTYEGGNILIAGMFGLNSAIGLAVAVTRRLRAIFWAAIGGLFLVLLSRSRELGDSDNDSTPGNILERPASDKQAQGARQFTAIILPNNSQQAGETSSPLLRVGTLPILLRDILAVRKAGARRIIVCVDLATGPSVQLELLETGRLPRSVEWLEVRSDTPLPQLLKQIASETGSDYLMLVAGNTTYYPALFQEVSEWNCKGGVLALTTGDQLVGIYALSADITFEVAEHSPSGTFSLEDLHAWLILNHPVRCEPVQEGLWQRVQTPEDRIAAERKLDRWLVKPTDGIFARMNRRISVPISRQIAKFPITPNMVSLFTLGVGFAAGLFFACGGYRNMLVGAMLSVWASILDGCDGEVARLKLLESDFGCWLETICDYLYYLFIFTGMAMGFVRCSETKTYLAWAALLLLGAVTSFLVTGLGRQRLASGRPEQYLGIWQAQADSRRSNPLLYIGRHTEFIVRRCFLPYAFLFFAVLNMMKVAFIMSAVGVNVVWLISLYSYLTFAVVRRSPLKDSAAA